MNLVNPLAMLRGGGPLATLAAKLATGAGRQLRELGELLPDPRFGPPAPPRWCRPALEAAADRTGLSVQLLGGVAWSVTRFNPGHAGGLLGLGEADRPAERIRAPLEELAARDAEAAAAARRGVDAAADTLARLVEASGYADGLLAYLDGAVGPSRAEEVAGRVLTALITYSSRSVADVDPERLLEEE